MVFKVILLLVFVAVKATEALCPTEYSEFNGKCYRIFDSETRSKSDAATRCSQDVNGTLATINNAFVNNFLSVLANNVSTTQFYMGINCPQISNIGDYSSCYWDDGTPFVYQNFKLNNLFPGSPCAYLDTQDTSNGFWRSFDCVTPLRFACQKNTVSTAKSTRGSRLQSPQ